MWRLFFDILLEVDDKFRLIRGNIPAEGVERGGPYQAVYYINDQRKCGLCPTRGLCGLRGGRALPRQLTSMKQTIVRVATSTTRIFISARSCRLVGIE